MIFLKRRRLILWLLKAYLKKWRRTILISFALGLIVFFILKFVVNYFIPLMPFTQEQTIGIIGAYTVDNLPSEILSKVSQGLVYAGPDDLPKPDLAKSWEIRNNGKTYVFHLKNNVYFSDGTKLTSNEIKYNFTDVQVQRPDNYTIIFNLKSVYSPFLLTVSRPVFKNGFVGVGNYKVQSVSLNGSFVQSISLVAVKGKSQETTYQFYATQDALKTAFALGDVNEVAGVRNLSFDGKSFSAYKQTEISKSTNYSQLVTLFYNTQDKDLSDKRLREALAYTIADTFNLWSEKLRFFCSKLLGQRGWLDYLQSGF
jgi:ABC-type transport system substrate-binding protein